MLLDLLQGSFSVETVLSTLIALAVVLFICMPVHECAHGWMASKLGDRTAYYQKRITLNPLKHIDPFGALCMLLVGFGWAKAVPVNPLNFKDPKKDMAITALAGPASNLLMACLFIFLQNVVLAVLISTGFYHIVLSIILSIFSYVALLNISLGIFNLIPVPPLDGSRILFAFLPDRYYYKLMQYEQYLWFLLVALLAFGTLSGPLYKIIEVVYSAFDWLTWLPFGFWVG